MALWDILAGASGGLRQGLDDLRQRQLQDEQRRRQAALDERQRLLEDTQMARWQSQDARAEREFEANQARQGLQDQVARFNLTNALIGGLTSGNLAPDYVRQLGGQLGITLPELQQRQVTREVRTEANRPSPDFMGPMPSVRANLTTTEQYDPLTALYDRDRRLALADEARRVELERAAQEAQRAWQERMAKAEQEAALRRVQIQESGANARNAASIQGQKEVAAMRPANQVNASGLTPKQQADYNRVRNQIMTGFYPSEQARQQALVMLNRTYGMPEDVDIFEETMQILTGGK